jgi:hypothetical protein
MPSDPFDDFFRAATGHQPYDYQPRLATDSPPESARGRGLVVARFSSWPGGGQGVAAEAVRSPLIYIPTGAGETASAVVGWRAELGTEPGGTSRRQSRRVRCRLPPWSLMRRCRSRYLKLLQERRKLTCPQPSPH